MIDIKKPSLEYNTVGELSEYVYQLVDELNYILNAITDTEDTTTTEESTDDQ